ncbi:4-phosphoerythronate dehydrogenase [Acinetobacter boissieri]|uniref:Erythronate-4-phosphate dehydrogenase n=1 Tax=Acinetobacter boissieri TaxID=1219383 RepID=A0A1G6HG72_9GAMM|nr:4-phosphoerythronate dehydrogenase [Acinetobacter boissieri]SDB93240.1 erythronate-4-phosphate dehydrogenase [Acinetobacter boissieri]
MKIIADENLALTDYFFSEFAQVVSLAGRTLTHAEVENADALLVRSVTKVNQQLLQESKVQFVGSATIGTDHLDIDYLQQNHIDWANAAGCNAQAVAEYVITALLYLKPQLLHAEKTFTLGVIGLGNVGQCLARVAQAMGWQVIGYDPFVSHQEIKQVTFDELLQQADAVSIHVPLTQTGDHATHHLFNECTLAQLRPHAILINSARGAVISEQALLADIQKTQRDVVLDVFEHEPKISQAVLDAVKLVTPHIAGYSLEGKARGTQMIYEAFCHHISHHPNKDFRTQLPDCEQFNQPLTTAIAQHMGQIYNILQDDQNLRACVQDGIVSQQAFDALRKNYPLRREWASHGIDIHA